MNFSMILGVYLGIALWFAEQLRIGLKDHENLQSKCKTPEIRNMVALFLTGLCLIWQATLIWSIFEVNKK